MKVPVTHITITALLVSLLFPTNALACSFSRSTKFTEMARNFSVQVTFERKPLPGVKASVHSFDSTRIVSSATTDMNGWARFREMASGRYYVEVRHLGILVASDQIEVLSRVSDKARLNLSYDWHESATEVRQIVGTVMDLVPQGSTPIERIVKPRLESPIGGAQIQLTPLRNNGIYTTTTDERGKFAITEVPNGAYVMHVRTSATSAADVGDFLVKLKANAEKESLEVLKGELCGGPHLFLQPN